MHICRAKFQNVNLPLTLRCHDFQILMGRNDTEWDKKTILIHPKMTKREPFLKAYIYHVWQAINTAPRFKTGKTYGWFNREWGPIRYGPANPWMPWYHMWSRRWSYGVIWILESVLNSTIIKSIYIERWRLHCACLSASIVRLCNDGVRFKNMHRNSTLIPKNVWFLWNEKMLLFVIKQKDIFLSYLYEEPELSTLEVINLWYYMKYLTKCGCTSKHVSQI